MSRARALLVTSALAAAGCAACRAGPAAPGETLRWVDGTAGRLRVSDGGAGGTPVVLMHGLGCDREVWRAQLDHLRATRRAIAYDQRGHGDSDRAGDGVYTIEALADDLEAVRRGLGLARFVLVGHSMSGAVLTTYAGRHPDTVAGLVYLDAAGDFHAYPADEVERSVEKARKATDAAARRAMFAGDLAAARPATREQVVAALDRMDPPAFGALFASMRGVRDARARFAPYRGPAIAVENAENHDADAASAVLGLRRLEIAKTSHWLQLDQPEAVNRALDGFLAALPPAP
jgi:pimeloyl-ACP methyl ester carboxylesterase